MATGTRKVGRHFIVIRKCICQRVEDWLKSKSIVVKTVIGGNPDLKECRLNQSVKGKISRRGTHYKSKKNQ